MVFIGIQWYSMVSDGFGWSRMVSDGLGWSVSVDLDYHRMVSNTQTYKWDWDWDGMDGSLGGRGIEHLTVLIMVMITSMIKTMMTLMMKLMMRMGMTVITGTFQCYGEPSRSRGIPEHPLSALEPKQ